MSKRTKEIWQSGKTKLLKIGDRKNLSENNKLIPSAETSVEVPLLCKSFKSAQKVGEKCVGHVLRFLWAKTLRKIFHICNKSWKRSLTSFAKSGKKFEKSNFSFQCLNENLNSGEWVRASGRWTVHFSFRFIGWFPTQRAWSSHQGQTLF